MEFANGGKVWCDWCKKEFKETDKVFKTFLYDMPYMACSTEHLEKAVAGAKAHLLLTRGSFNA